MSPGALIKAPVALKRAFFPLFLRQPRLNFSFSAPISPNLLQYKVGKIINCQNHPNADKLYVSRVSLDSAIYETVDDTTADAISAEQQQQAKVVTVCSGLKSFVSREDLVGRRIVVIGNLKASKMRGVRSEAMVLAAEKKISQEQGKGSQENGDTGIQVELVNPPLNSKIGAQLVFKKIDDREPSKAAVQHKKIKDAKKLVEIMAGMVTDADKFVSFEKEYLLVDPEAEAGVVKDGDKENVGGKIKFAAFADKLNNAVVR